MLLERLVGNLHLDVEPFATCGVAEGWRLRLPARHPATLHFVLTGNGRLIAGTGDLALPTHALALVPPGLTHHLEVGDNPRVGQPAVTPEASGLTHLAAGPREGQALLVVCGALKASWAGGAGLFDHLTEAVVADFSEVPRMHAIFEALLAEQASGAPGRMAMMAALMQQCLVEFFRRVCGQECDLPWLHALEDPRLARALEAIHETPAAPHSLESLAEAAAMSRSAFAARFKTVFGQTATDYLRDVRLREAARLLQQPELSVDAAAARAGFSSRSHFSRAFRRMFGTSPGEYRGS